MQQSGLVEEAVLQPTAGVASSASGLWFQEEGF